MKMFYSRFRGLFSASLILFMAMFLLASVPVASAQESEPAATAEAAEADPKPADDTAPEEPAASDEVAEQESSSAAAEESDAEPSADGEEETLAEEPATEETAATKPVAAKPVAGGTPWYLTAAVVLSMLILPFWFGNRAAERLKMPDHGLKIGVMICTILAATVITGTRWPPKYGVDLSGGINMIYQIDPEFEKTDEEGVKKTIDMDKMIAAVSRRVNPAGQKDVTIRRYGERQIEIIIPKADPAEVEQLKEILGTAGIMEFRITASHQDNEDSGIIERAERSTRREVKIGDEVVAKWVFLDPEEFPPEKQGILVTREATNGRIEVLVKLDLHNVTGDFLVSALSGIDDGGRPSVNFSFNSRGAKRFADLTRENAPIAGSGFERKLGIVLDNVLLSAPNLKEPITGGRGQISGDFSKKEVEVLIGILNAGALPAALDKTPISEINTSSTLGDDTIHRGKMAMGVSMGLVLVFMIFYYRFAGFVACFALAANIVLLLAVMISIKAAFTLPGIAGLVLTVGMAVDANVLIFERIREELARGSALRLAIRNGFAKATTTIVDANLTTLITAVVLYWIGTDQIKGFAITLILGIVMSMYTAIFCSRIIFDIAERVRWIKGLSMLRILGTTTIDFVGKRHLAATISLAIIVLGMVGVFKRGQSLLDIDFLGGSSVTITFNEQQKIGYVRKAAGGLSDVTVRGVDIGQGEGYSFSIDTLDRDIEHVKDILQGAFEGKLVTHTLGFSPPKGAEMAESESSDSESTDAEVVSSMTSDLTFGERIKYESLEKLILDGFETIGVPEISFQLANPQYQVGSGQAYKRWELSAEMPLDVAEKLLVTIQTKIEAMTVFPSASNIGGRVAGDTQAQAFYALSASLIFIVGYIWLRFQRIMFGLAAVVALVHDVLITLGVLALSGYLVNHAGFIATPLLIDEFKISLPIVAAFLTIIGYSLNDTIVVFDRIREVRGKSPLITAEMVNTSINQTLSRTLLTSVTTLIVVVILYIAGGPGIHGFAFSLVVGVLVGTYSSIFVASPVLLWMAKSPGDVSGTRKQVMAERAALKK